MKPWYKVILLILVFYVVGIIASFTPLKEMTFKLTPIILVMTLSAVLWSLNNRLITLFSLIVGVYGYLWEVLGVYSGFPFGEYSYGEGLGISLFNVPLILIVNWSLMSVLCHYSFVKINSRYLRILLASLAMVIVDFLIEPVAINFDWWSWQSVNVPWTNYLGWFGISISVMSFYELIGHSINSKNRVKLVSNGYLAIQVAFFLLVNLSLWVQ